MPRHERAAFLVTALACAFLVACDDDADPSPTGGGGGRSTSAAVSSGAATSSSTSSGGAMAEVAHRSGDRLRAFVLEGGPGAVELELWVDTQLDSPCTFLQGADGVFRCYPGDARTEGYADAACTVPLLGRANGQCGTPHFVHAAVPDSMTCVGTNPASHFSYERRWSSFTVGAAHAGPVYEHAGADCVLVDRPAEGLFAYGNEVDPSQLVAASETWELRGDRAEVRVLQGSDGSSTIERVRDAATKGTCNFIPTADDVSRCLPPYIAYRFAEDFADESCSVPVTDERIAGPDCPTERTAIFSFVDDAAYEIGAILPTNDIFKSSGGFCQAWSGQSDKFRYREVGARIPDDTFFGTTFEPRGTGALRARGRHLVTGEILGHGTLTYDASVDRTCTLGIYQDEVRCVWSDDVELDEYFANASCTQPLVTARSGTQVPRVVNMKRSPDEDLPAETCGHFSHAASSGGNVVAYTDLRVLTPHDGPVYRRVGSCQVANDVIGYEIGGPAPKEWFQPITARLE